MNAQWYGRLGLSLAGTLIPALLAPAAFGQAPSSDAEGSPVYPLYRIEVIVFAQGQGNPGEEAFEHIARREAIESASGADEIAVFDFGPYIVAEDLLLEDPAAESSVRSRLMLGRGDEREGGVSPESSARPEANTAAEPGPSGPGTTNPAGAATTAEDAAVAGPPAEAGGDGEGELAADPFGGDPGNAVAPFRFRLLDETELELGNIRRRLERAAGYTLLVHGGWIQQGLPPQQARPFDLAYLGASTPSGTIRLHVSRFLHLTLDLDYRPFAAGTSAPSDAPDDSAEDDSFGAERQGAFGVERPGAFGPVRPTLSEIDVTRHYVLNAERRVRSGEVHYFDHPFLGVIAVVEPYEPPEPPQTEGVRPAA